MLHRYASLFTVAVNAFKPLLHAGMILNILAASHQRFTGQLRTGLPGLFHHTVHIGENGIHHFIPGNISGMPPKFRRLHTDAGNKGILLHITGAQRLIKIVHNRNNGFLHWRISFHFDESLIRTRDWVRCVKRSYLAETAMPFPDA